VNDLDALVREALTDAVDYVEPAHRLAAIRARTRRRRAPRYAAAAVGLAAAALMVGVAVQHRPAEQAEPATDPARASEVGPVAVYYVGSTPSGPMLYREFRRSLDVAAGTSAAELVATAPDDPDYRTPWRPGDLTPGPSDGTTVEVALRDAELRERPDGTTAREAWLGLQQVVWTAAGALGRTTTVTFTLDGVPADRVLGVPLDGPVAAAPQLSVLASVSVSDPVEGRVVRGAFTARGRATAFEGSVLWRLVDGAGTVVRSGHAQASMEDHLTPWETRVEVAGLPAGRYEFAATGDDPSGGEHPQPTDTRTVIVR
jgi:hypothetical protein